MTRKHAEPAQQPEPEEQEEETPSVNDSEPVLTPAAENSPQVEPPTKAHEEKAEEKEADRILAAVQRSAQLQTQNLELVVSRVQQMADSQAQLYKAHQEALNILKTSAELMQEYMAQLNEQTERLVTVSAALLRYSQEQAAMIASGGNQA